ncbi:MAG: TetR/AcrR family transcriptional regulator [Firmicutes bacterium]|mgnify:CR=1 FL=1|nr:TetR/AcrR family transcriptional regulator [Bacillota bacterium]
MAAGHAEKEIAIFNGLMKLLRRGANPYLIKVQDIAEAAGIGKGTVYDYFASKEEVISKAILYHLNQELKAAFQRIAAKKTLREKFSVLLDLIQECLGDNRSTVNLLLSGGGLHNFYTFLKEQQQELAQLKEKVLKIIDHLLEHGRAEKIINSRESEFYQLMALQGALAGFSHFVGQRDLYPDVTVEEAKNVAYKLLLKALG